MSIKEAFNYILYILIMFIILDIWYVIFGIGGGTKN